MFGHSYLEAPHYSSFCQTDKQTDRQTGGSTVDKIGLKKKKKIWKKRNVPWAQLAGDT